MHVFDLVVIRTVKIECFEEVLKSVWVLGKT